MALPVLRSFDFGGVTRILNLPDGASPQEPATVAQLNSAVEGLNWKDSARVATQANINLAAPGATIDGATMATGDRVLVRTQTAAVENGIYVWNGAGVPMTRTPDANTFAELEQATVTVEEGTSAGTTYRQTAVNGVIDSSAVSWSTFGTAAGAASTSSAGIVQLATSAEVATGTDAAKAITPAALAASGSLIRRFAANIGDGSATSYTVTHNLGTRDCQVVVYRNSGIYDTVLAEIQRPSINAVVVLTDVAPAANAYRVVVLA